MSYYMSRTIESGFDEAVARVVDALKREGFGVLSDIDVAATLKQKYPPAECAAYLNNAGYA